MAEFYDDDGVMGVTRSPPPPREQVWGPYCPIPQEHPKYVHEVYPIWTSEGQ